LDRAIGQIHGFCSAGEVRYLFERGLLRNELCGCGSELRSCEFWERVGKEAFGGWDRIDLGEVLWLRGQVDQPSRIPHLLAGRALRGFLDLTLRYGEYLRRTYLGILRASGSEVVVDSSMSPPYSLVLEATPGVDLRVVHLVRDARGVAYSSAKEVSRPEVTSSVDHMPVYKPPEVAARWTAANALYALRARTIPTIQVRYESFVNDPVRELKRIVVHAGRRIDGQELGFVGDGQIRLDTDHTAAGNPMRFQSGGVALQLDEEWRTSMADTDRRIVTAIASPMLYHLGYVGARRWSG
jgi:hypothetical protein